MTGYIYGGTYSSQKYAIISAKAITKAATAASTARPLSFTEGTYNGGISAITRAQQTGNPYVSGGTFRKGESPNDTRIRSSKGYIAEAASTMPPPA